MDSKLKFIMKYLFIYLFSFIACENKGQTIKPTATELISIRSTGNFVQFKQHVATLKYFVLDSSANPDGSIYYISRDLKAKKNVLSCMTDKKLKVQQIIFSTLNLETYIEYKYFFRKNGFKSSGISKKEYVPGLKESEDFEKGNMLVSCSVKKNGDELEYEFLFLKM